MKFSIAGTAVSRKLVFVLMAALLLLTACGGSESSADSGSGSSAGSAGLGSTSSEPETEPNPEPKPEPEVAPPVTLTVSAGANRSLTLPQSRITLEGSGSASDGGTVRFSWEQTSGVNALLSGIHTANLQVSGLSAGQYQFQLTVSRAGVSASDSVTINVGRMDLSHFWAGPISDERKSELDDLVLNSSIQPPDVHPRLYGTNEEWAKRFEAFDDLDSQCTLKGKHSGVGTVKNVKTQWEWMVRGGRTCEGQPVPSNAGDHWETRDYMDGSVDTSIKANNDLRLRVLYLIRYLRYCHQQNPDDGSVCQFSAEDTQKLSKKFIQAEVERLRNAPRSTDVPMWAGELGYPPDFHFIAWWHRTSGKFFDLGAWPAFKFWSLFLDTFWNEPALRDGDQAYIEQEMEYEIDSYLKSAEVGYWNLANGNNWTPTLNAAALYWVILNWHEKPAKARRVLKYILQYNWLHRDTYLADGAYLEGPSYISASLKPIVDMQQLLRTGFGQMLHSFVWFTAAEKTPRWMMSNVAPDGHAVNFGDAWARYGNTYFGAFTLMLAREVLGLEEWGSTSPDACLVQSWFINSYYNVAFSDPWRVSPALARDWYSIAQPCDVMTTGGGVRRRIFPEYGQGVLRAFNPGASFAAESATDIDPHTRQADQTYLTINGVINSGSHREMDFGALIWSAYGNRLLFDFGYGGIVRNYFEYDVVVPMNHSIQLDYMLGANQLVIPSAFHTWYDNDIGKQRTTYAAEAFGGVGSIEPVTVDGLDALLADGANVLGGSSEAYVHRPAVEGPLKY